MLTKDISETSSFNSVQKKFASVGLTSTAISHPNPIRARTIRWTLYFTTVLSLATLALSSIHLVWESYTAHMILASVFGPLGFFFAISLLIVTSKPKTSATAPKTSHAASITGAVILACGWAATFAMAGISLRELGDDMSEPWYKRSKQEVRVRLASTVFVFLSLVVQVFLVVKMVAERRLWKAAQRAVSLA